jgi:hypothetical protein
MYILYSMVAWTFATSRTCSSHIHKLVSFNFYVNFLLTFRFIMSRKLISSLAILVSLEVT